MASLQVEEGQPPPPAALPSSGPPRQTVTDDEGNTVTLSLDIKSVKPYRTQDEYLYAMKEDLAEWFNALYDLPITVDDFFEQLETGVVLCQHANALQNFIAGQLDDDVKRGSGEGQGQGLLLRISNNRYPVQLPSSLVVFRSRVQPGSFQSRDNISNFIAWCRQVLGIPDTLLFETEDLVSRKNERNVVLCVLEVARRGASYGMLAPKLVQFEAEIEAEMAEDEEEEGRSDGAKKDYNRNQQLQHASQAAAAAAARKQKPWIECDMMSLDEMVRLILSACTCEHQFPMVRVSEGKYRFGESMSLIFLRILRNHVMVRIGGGWDTLECFLDRYDPCRCKSKEHRGTMAFATKPTATSHASEQPKPLVAATVSSSSCPSSHHHHSTVVANHSTQAKDSPSIWTKGSPQKHPHPQSKETTQQQQQPEKTSKQRSQEQSHPPLKPKPQTQSPLHTTKRPESQPGPGPGSGQGPGPVPGSVFRRSPSPVPSSNQPSKSQGIQGNRLNGPVKPSSVAKRLDTRPSSASPSLARAKKTFKSSGDLLSSSSRTTRCNSPTRGQSPTNNRQALVRTGSSSTVLDTTTDKNSSGSRSGSGVGRGTSSRSATPSGSFRRSNSMEDSTKLTASPFRPKNHPRPATAAPTAKAAVIRSTGQQRPLSSTSRTKSSPNVILAKSDNKRRVTTTGNQLTKSSSRSSGNLTQKLKLGLTADRLLPSYGHKKWSSGDCRSSSLDVSPSDEGRVLRGIDDDVDDEEHPSRMRRSASLQPSVSFTLLHIDDYPDPAPPEEDEDLNSRMEMLFEEYRNVELRQTFPADKTDKKQTNKKSVSGPTSSKKNPSATPSSSSSLSIAMQGRCRSRERVNGSETSSRSLFRPEGVNKNDKQGSSARNLCPSSANSPSDEKVSSKSSNRPASSSLLDRGHKMVPRKESNSWSADQSQPGSADHRHRSSFDASSRSADDARPRSSTSWRPKNVLTKERTLSGSRESFTVGVGGGGAGSLSRRTGALQNLSKSFGDISDIRLTPRPTTSNHHPASRTPGTQDPCCSEEMSLYGCNVEGSDLNSLQINVDLSDSLVKAKPRKDDRKLGPPTRIPLPVGPGDQRHHDHSSGSLKRFDSGVDITNISPTGDNGSTQGDDEEETGEAGSCRGWAISVQRSEARSLSDQKLVFAAPPQVEDEYY